MSARLLLWYHARLGLSWAALAPPLALAALLVGLSGTWPLSQRVRDLGMALEVGLPLVAALLAAPLLMAERERETLCWLAVRVSLCRALALRLALLALYLLTCDALTLLAAHLLWQTPWRWEAVPDAAAPALAFAALALLAAQGGRNTVHGYLLAVAVWLGVLMVSGLLPSHEPWLTLNPFAWSLGYSADIVAHSMILYVAVGLLLLLPQRALLRPERLLRKT